MLSSELNCHLVLFLTLQSKQHLLQQADTSGCIAWPGTSLFSANQVYGSGIQGCYNFIISAQGYRQTGCHSTSPIEDWFEFAV
jgi:hypothetical protein